MHTCLLGGCRACFLPRTQHCLYCRSLHSANPHCAALTLGRAVQRQRVGRALPSWCHADQLESRRRGAAVCVAQGRVCATKGDPWRRARLLPAVCYAGAAAGEGMLADAHLAGLLQSSLLILYGPACAVADGPAGLSLQCHSGRPCFCCHPAPPFPILPTPQAQHGFARNMAWQVAEEGPASCRLVLESSEATLAQWPHPFWLEMAVSGGGGCEGVGCTRSDAVAS